jgi:hypothetical protein
MTTAKVETGEVLRKGAEHAMMGPWYEARKFNF